MVHFNQTLMQTKDIVLLIGAVSGLATAAITTVTKPVLQEHRLVFIEKKINEYETVGTPVSQKLAIKLESLEETINRIDIRTEKIDNKVDKLKGF